MLLAMFLSALIFSCSLFLSIGCRSTTSQQVTWLGLGQTDVKWDQLKQFFLNGSSKNLGSGLVEVDGLSPRHALGFDSRINFDGTKAGVHVELETAKIADLEVKTRPEVKVDTEADVKVKARPNVKVGTEADVKVKTDADVKVKATPDVKVETETETNNWAELGEEAKVILKGRSHVGTGTRIEVDETKVSKVGFEAKSVAEGVSELRVRGEPLNDEDERSNSGLLTTDVEDLAVKTMQPFLEWTRTMCRHLPVDVELMINFRLTSGQGHSQIGSSMPNLNSKTPHLNDGKYRSRFNWDGRSFKYGPSFNDPVTRNRNIITLPPSRHLKGGIESSEYSRFVEAKKRTPKSRRKQPQHIPQEKVTGITNGLEDEVDQHSVKISYPKRQKWNNDLEVFDTPGGGAVSDLNVSEERPVEIAGEERTLTKPRTLGSRKDTKTRYPGTPSSNRRETSPTHVGHVTKQSSHTVRLPFESK